MLNTASLTLFALLAAPFALAQELTPGGPCPVGGGNFCAGMGSPYPVACIDLLELGTFTNIILRCSTDGPDGVLNPGNCNDNVFLPISEFC
jgi:hypothetical protein